MKPWVIASLLALSLFTSDLASAEPPLITRPLPMPSVMLAPIAQASSMTGAAHVASRRLPSGSSGASQRHSHTGMWVTITMAAVAAYFLLLMAFLPRT